MNTSTSIRSILGRLDVASTRDEIDAVASMAGLLVDGDSIEADLRYLRSVLEQDLEAAEAEEANAIAIAAEIESTEDRDAAIASLTSLVDAALGAQEWTGRASRYAVHGDIKIRVSDHEQPIDGGYRATSAFGEEMEGRFGAADVSLLTNAKHSIESIRAAVEAAIHAAQ